MSTSREEEESREGGKGKGGRGSEGQRFGAVKDQRSHRVQFPH